MSRNKNQQIEEKVDLDTPEGAVIIAITVDRQTTQFSLASNASSEADLKLIHAAVRQVEGSLLNQLLASKNGAGHMTPPPSQPPVEADEEGEEA